MLSCICQEYNAPNKYYFSQYFHPMGNATAKDDRELIAG